VNRHVTSGGASFRAAEERAVECSPHSRPLRNNQWHQASLCRLGRTRRGDALFEPTHRRGACVRLISTALYGPFSCFGTYSTWDRTVCIATIRLRYGHFGGGYSGLS